jgi:hypothetical protein
MVMIKLDFDEIQSSNIDGLTFLAEQENNTFANHCSVTGKLLVEYSTGDVYKYDKVPLAVVMNIIGAQSVGSTASRLLRSFKYEKVVSLDDI